MFVYCGAFVHSAIVMLQLYTIVRFVNIITGHFHQAKNKRRHGNKLFGSGYTAPNIGAGA